MQSAYRYRHLIRMKAVRDYAAVSSNWLLTKALAEYRLRLGWGVHFNLTVSPGQCTPRINARPKKSYFLINSTIMDYSKLDHDAWIEFAIVDIDTGESPIITEVVKK
jgi:hypothetical protein